MDQNWSCIHYGVMTIHHTCTVESILFIGGSMFVGSQNFLVHGEVNFIGSRLRIILIHIKQMPLFVGMKGYPRKKGTLVPHKHWWFHSMSQQPDVRYRECHWPISSSSSITGSSLAVVSSVASPCEGGKCSSGGGGGFLWLSRGS